MFIISAKYAFAAYLFEGNVTNSFLRIFDARWPTWSSPLIIRSLLIWRFESFVLSFVFVCSAYSNPQMLQPVADSSSAVAKDTRVVALFPIVLSIFFLLLEEHWGKWIPNQFNSHSVILWPCTCSFPLRWGAILLPLLSPNSTSIINLSTWWNNPYLKQFQNTRATVFR